MILTNEQTRMLTGMSRYWEEVSKREDTSQLSQELADVYRMLGVKILWIIKEYVENNPSTEDSTRRS